MTAKILWRKLWDAAGGPPTMLQEDLQLLSSLFELIDTDSNGVLDDTEMATLRNSIFTSLANGLLGTFDTVLEGEEGLGVRTKDDATRKEVTADDWVAFHVAAYSTFGRREWRQAMSGLVAVRGVTRVAPPLEEPWVVSVSHSGAIHSTWFSKAELQPEERAACRTLKDVGGWRCLSCEAEAYERSDVSPKIRRSISNHVDQVADHVAVSPPPPPGKCVRYATEMGSVPIDHQLGSDINVSESVQTIPARRTCTTLSEMLSHRAMRPLRKAVQVGETVIVEDVTRGTSRESFLGLPATVTRIFYPEKAAKTEMWCCVEITKETATTSSVEALLPVRSVACMKVPLHPGDIVETYRHVSKHLISQTNRTQETCQGTYLGEGAKGHLVEVRFGDEETEQVPLSWVMRSRMSAWTQVLRSAPHSTLIFLLCDLRLTPLTSDDWRELEDRLRRDFEPHGRFRFVGLETSLTGGERNGSETDENRGSSSPQVSSRKRAPMFAHLKPTARSREFLAIGDRGKLLSIDLEKLECLVVADRKKHLQLWVALEAVEPDKRELEVTARSGPSSMHSFAEDPTLLAAAKKNAVGEVRKLLSQVPSNQLEKTLFQDNVDPDGNTLFHAAIYAQSKELFRCVWSAAFAINGGVDEDLATRSLLAANDWGRTPLWIAIESRRLDLCELLLKAEVSLEQMSTEAPVIPETQSNVKPIADPTEFNCGPGLVSAGTEFEVTLYSPSWNLVFGHSVETVTETSPKLLDLTPSSSSPSLSSSPFVVTRSSGEAATARVMAGDVLLSLNGTSVSSITSVRGLEARLARANRPLALRFLKGRGLLIRPLHRACELGYHEIVKLLLESMADASWRDVTNRSAMDMAVLCKRKRDNVEPFEMCIALLGNAGASEEGHVKICDAEGGVHSFEAPLHWDDSAQFRLEGRFWCNIKEETSSELIHIMQRVVDRSVGADATKQLRTKDRRDGLKIPDHLFVRRVERIENAQHLCDYLERRHHIQHAIRKGVGTHFRPVTDLRVKVNYAALLGVENAQELLDSRLNEVFLFHGTSCDAARSIAYDDFHLDMAGSVHGDAFGRGIYFAENCLKCDEYTVEAPRHHEFAGLRPLLLCRVLLGRVLIETDRDVAWCVRSAMEGSCDSIIADRKAAVGTFREFVIFDQDQVYTEYILWYERHYGKL
eukprot:TRINITY_DN34297_c0_g1_i1.p1 TRINITY_DN34297_c0_g1~~TRINITY_DN34297_c0_g1_i1.p1  ORF type:complete len:1174 (+),score=175.13 TRINITY_DN34297_c0_g1_i1:138-3659(+)